MGRISLSIIICTFNRSALLALLLDSIIRECTDQLDLELIVVDNGSSDDTPQVVSQYMARMPKLSYAVEPQQGLSIARNRGAALATGEFLLYLDDDAYLSEGYLERTEIVLRRFRPDFFGGPVIPYFDGPIPDWFDPEGEVRQYLPRSGFSSTARMSGGNFGVRRSVLQSLGPFDTDLGMKGEIMGFGEDREMIERYRARSLPSEQRLYYAVELSIHHLVPAYKLDRRYQLRRRYKNAIAREFLFICSGKQTLLRSIVLVSSHIGLLPYTIVRILIRERFSSKGRFGAVKHLWAVAGQTHGIIQAAFERLSARMAARSNGWRWYL